MCTKILPNKKKTDTIDYGYGTGNNDYGFDHSHSAEKKLHRIKKTLVLCTYSESKHISLATTYAAS